jgi:peroxiredoxin Q/BCP
MEETVNTNIKVGDSAPAFVLQDQSGKVQKLSDYKGRWLLVYFYPKDDTPGCTTEACQIRDGWASFKKKNIGVLGVSTDSVESHEKFAEKFNLPFPLLADTDKKMVAAYGVWGEKQYMGKSYMGTNRTSFLIDPKGQIAKIYPKVKADGHAEEVLKDLAELGA